MKNIKKISIIGIGLMGGSLALALKKKYPKASIWGYARSQKSFTKIKKSKVVDELTTDLKTLVSDAQIVVLATPVNSIIKAMTDIRPFLKKGAIVFDLGSSKKVIDKAAQNILKVGVDFVGCHPLCGGDVSGVAFSKADLYQGSTCIITSDPKRLVVKRVAKIWQALGSRVFFMSPDEHDRILSSISHLPHLISFAMTDFIVTDFLKFAPASFRDLTRISNSPGSVWVDILTSNKKNILSDIKKFQSSLKKFEQSLRQDNKTQLLSKITKVNQKHKKL